MVEQIESHALDCAGYTGIAKFSPGVLQAMLDVPRHEFVSESNRSAAYLDSPLLIGYGQTISQPFIVALMCEVLGLNKTDRVLEIGTGCGYHAAVLSRLCQRVYTVEVVEELALVATRNLAGYDNVQVFCQNGIDGLRDFAPFDAISVAAAVDEIPASLREQLAHGGRMIIPVRDPLQMGQTLVFLKKNEDGSVTQKNILPVVFVPFVKG